MKQKIKFWLDSVCKIRSQIFIVTTALMHLSSFLGGGGGYKHIKECFFLTCVCIIIYCFLHVFMQEHTNPLSECLNDISSV